jgi:hypothetical protein
LISNASPDDHSSNRTKTGGCHLFLEIASNFASIPKTRTAVKVCVRKISGLLNVKTTTISLQLQVRAFAILVALACCAADTGFAAEPLQPVRVSDNGHYFVKADGAPFFWQADTAWGIFNHAAPADVDAYLDDRKARGFNVIQGVIALWDYNRHTNCDGELPFLNGDLGRINEAYYKNVDSILDKAEAHGMYMAVLPYWHKNAGDRLGTNGIPEEMQAYCKFLAKRYARRNIFWILGGDSTADGEAGEKIQHVTDLEARGLIEGAREAGVNKIMISYHPTGQQSSSFWFHDSPWLDFNSIQSGHVINTTGFQLVGADYARIPVKPALDMEPGYENITDGLVGYPDARRLQAVDVRRTEYLDVFAGAAGLTYGQGEVYGFNVGGKVFTRWGTAMSWKEALKLPASGQMQYIRHLIESRPMLERIPDQSLITGGVSTRAVRRVEAMRGADGSYAFVYLPAGKTNVTINTGKLSGAKLVAWWFNPRTGKAKRSGSFAQTDTREFTPPSGGAGNDWVLVLDDAAKKYPPPGLVAGEIRRTAAFQIRGSGRQIPVNEQAR